MRWRGRCGEVVGMSEGFGGVGVGVRGGEGERERERFPSLFVAEGDEGKQQIRANSRCFFYM